MRSPRKKRKNKEHTHGIDIVGAIEEVVPRAGRRIDYTLHGVPTMRQVRYPPAISSSRRTLRRSMPQHDQTYKRNRRRKAHKLTSPSRTRSVLTRPRTRGLPCRFRSCLPVKCSGRPTVRRPLRVRGSQTRCKQPVRCYTGLA